MLNPRLRVILEEKVGVETRWSRLKLRFGLELEDIKKKKKKQKWSKGFLWTSCH